MLASSALFDIGNGIVEMLMAERKSARVMDFWLWHRTCKMVPIWLMEGGSGLGLARYPNAPVLVS